MNYEKPGGTMHEVIRRAFDELRLHNNPQGAITIVTHALANAERLPPLSSGKDYNGDIVPNAVSTYTRGADGPSSSPGGSGGAGEINRSRPVGAAARASQSSASSMQWFTAGSVGVAITSPSPTSYSTASVALPAGSAEWLNKRNTFNRTQLLRLLLIRCEAFSAIKQHARALEDAERAVEVSQGQSAEAYFNVGREQRRQFNIVESASAFDTAEALLRSMQQAIAAGKVVVDGWSQETATDEEFWADRGFQMEEVRDMGITRREYEMQERNSHRLNLGNSFSGPNSPTTSGAPGNGRGEPQTPLSNTGRTRSRFGFDGNGLSSFTASPFDGQISQGNSVTTRSINLNTSVAADGNNNNTNNNNMNDDDAAGSSYVTDLIQCGMSPNELAMWRRLANESRALLAMRQTHTVPSTVLSSTMTLLDRRISGTRGGLVISIENNTHSPLRFVGALAPDGLYHESYSFPDVVSKAHCGVSMLHPRGWGGYSGAVCYELHENLCCFLYFDSPLLGSVKYGVRFVDLRAADLRRAYAEVYKETGVYGIAGGTTTMAITPPAAAGSASATHNGSTTPNSGCRGGSFGPSSHNPSSSGGGGVSIRGAHTPLTTTVASMNAARAAIRTPPSNTWVASHAASPASQRPVKASARMVGGQAIAFSLAEMLPVRLRSVELIPALEYVGPVTLKKMSAVSRRYRELVNNLPPPMFYGIGRRAYPDYCVASDRYISPWVVRDAQPVTWKLVFDGRLGDQEEFSVSDETDLQKHILCFSADAQTKVTGYVYLGDKRCLQYIIKESWIPFSNTLYFTTPIGRTFASCVAMNNQSQFTLSLNSSSQQASGNGAAGGPPRPGDDILYTARKRVQPAAATSNDSTPVPAGTVRGANGGSSAGAEDGGLIMRGKVSPGTTALQQAHAITHGCSPAEAAGKPSSASRTSPAQAVLATAVTTATGTHANNPPNTAAGAATSSGAAVMGSAVTTGSTSGGGAVAQGSVVTGTTTTGTTATAKTVSPRPAGTTAGATATATSAGGSGASYTPAPTAPEFFTVWRSQRVSGGAVAGGSGPTTTNGGADIIAEVKVNPVVYGMVTKGYCAAEITLYPGADAMLVALLSFLMTRW